VIGAQMSRRNAIRRRRSGRGICGGVLAESGLLPIRQGRHPVSAALDHSRATASTLSIPLWRPAVVRSGDNVGGSRESGLHHRPVYRGSTKRRTARVPISVLKPSTASGGTRFHPSVFVARRRDPARGISCEPCAVGSSSRSTLYPQLTLCAGRRGTSGRGLLVAAEQVRCL